MPQVFEVMCRGRNSKGLIELSRKDLLPKPRRTRRTTDESDGEADKAYEQDGM